MPSLHCGTAPPCSQYGCSYKGLKLILWILKRSNRLKHKINTFHYILSNAKLSKTIDRRKSGRPMQVNGAFYSIEKSRVINGYNCSYNSTTTGYPLENAHSAALMEWLEIFCDNVFYLAGRQSSTTVDIAVEIERSFWYTPVKQLGKAWARGNEKQLRLSSQQAYIDVFIFIHTYTHTL